MYAMFERNAHGDHKRELDSLGYSNRQSEQPDLGARCQEWDLGSLEK